MRLEKACYAYLYENHPHVMACLDAALADPQAILNLWLVPDGSQNAVWRWRRGLEKRPPWSGGRAPHGTVLTPERRGLTHVRSWEQVWPSSIDSWSDATTSSDDARRHYDCMHLFGPGCAHAVPGNVRPCSRGAQGCYGPMTWSTVRDATPNIQLTSCLGRDNPQRYALRCCLIPANFLAAHISAVNLKPPSGRQEISRLREVDILCESNLQY